MLDVKTHRSPTTSLILDAASDLFFHHGYGNVSMDWVASAAGTTKVTVYQHFESKEELLLACLQHRLVHREATLDERFAGRGESAACVLDLFDWLEASLKKNKFAGCAFTKTVNEMSEVLPEVRRIAQKAKRLLRERMISLAVASGLQDAEELGSELAVLLEGAQVLSLIEHSARPFRTANHAAMKLLTFHGWNPTQEPMGVALEKY